MILKQLKLLKILIEPLETSRENVFLRKEIVTA